MDFFAQAIRDPEWPVILALYGVAVLFMLIAATLLASDLRLNRRRQRREAEQLEADREEYRATWPSRSGAVYTSLHTAAVPPPEPTPVSTQTTLHEGTAPPKKATQPARKKTATKASPSRKKTS